MAAGIMPLKDGTYDEQECHHQDCAAMRYQWQLPCSMCGKGIEPGERYYIEKTDGTKVIEQAHALCVERAKEAPRQ